MGDNRTMSRVPRLAVVVLASFAAGGCYSFERQEGLGDGEIHMVVRSGGAGVAGARAVVVGRGTSAVSGDDGSLALRDLPAGDHVVIVTLDTNDDGVADAGAVVTALIEELPIPKSLTDGWFGEAPRSLNTLLLGEVDLEAAFAVSGTVTVDGAAFDPATTRARVVAFRSLDLGDGAAQSLPVEAAAGVGADGSYALAGLFGDVELVVFSAPVATPLVPNAFGVGEVVSAAGVIDLDADVAVSANAEGSLLVTLSDATERQNATVFVQNPETGADLNVEDVGPVDNGLNTLNLTSPIGVWAVSVQTDERNAALAPVAVLPDTRAYGPFTLIVGSVCDRQTDDGAVVIDCDDDGAPPIDAADLAGCAAACTDADARCTVADVERDCDDDGDGLVDPAEPACAGPDRGADRDGDGLCEPAADPFPGCAGNDPATC